MLWAAWAVALGVGCQIFSNTDELSDGKCDVGQKLCENLRECVSVMDPATGCGNPSCAPCVLLNTFAMCSADDYRCENAACHEGYRSCNPNIAVEDGCETDIVHDPDNCGDCGIECPEVPNGYRACSNMKCALGGCDLGYEHCDDDLTNGCETEIWIDERCGGCLAGPCPVGQTCQAGVCR